MIRRSSLKHICFLKLKICKSDLVVLMINSIDLLNTYWNKFKKALFTKIQDLNKKMIETSMDRPNVGIALAKKLTLIEAKGLPQFLIYKSYSLHIILGAFKSGVEATLWKIKKVLNNLNWYFENTSARRYNNVNETVSTTFPS